MKTKKLHKGSIFRLTKEGHQYEVTSSDVAQDGSVEISFRSIRKVPIPQHLRPGVKELEPGYIYGRLNLKFVTHLHMDV